MPLLTPRGFPQSILRLGVLSFFDFYIPICRLIFSNLWHIDLHCKLTALTAQIHPDTVFFIWKMWWISCSSYYVVQLLLQPAHLVNVLNLLAISYGNIRYVHIRWLFLCLPTQTNNSETIRGDYYICKI